MDNFKLGYDRQLARRLCRKISIKVVRSFQKMHVMMSGDDTPLKNTWDEICVQVQGGTVFCLEEL